MRVQTRPARKNETIEPDDFRRVQQFALEQLMVAVMRVLCDNSENPNKTRAQLGRQFEELVEGFDLACDGSAAKREALLGHMMEHGLKLVAQLRER